ncbi:MAG: (2Fe-2S)-binding protein [Streptosporangiales bacterium]|nr:(2Fe-2S)-binding protein [Streptosporangiales bacterium]
MTRDSRMEGRAMNRAGEHDGDERSGRKGVSPLVPAMERIESAAFLDSVADRLSPAVQPLVSSTYVRDALCGRWLGHALHPLLTDLPLGAWLSASLLDVFGGRRSRPAAEGLLAFGVAAAVPTALAGAAEWAATTGRERRVGVLHATTNTIALGLYTASLATRRRGRHSAAVALGIAGGITATAGGYLGGHLTINRKVGTTVT